MSTAAVVPERDPETGAITRAHGVNKFESGEATRSGIGYTAATVIVDPEPLGNEGSIKMVDFVLDWANSLAFQNPDRKTGSGEYGQPKPTAATQNKSGLPFVISTRPAGWPAWVNMRNTSPRTNRRRQNASPNFGNSMHNSSFFTLHVPTKS